MCGLNSLSYLDQLKHFHEIYRMYSLQRNPLTATWLYVGQRRCLLHVTYLDRETRHNARPALGRADDINERRRHLLGGEKLSVLLKFI